MCNDLLSDGLHTRSLRAFLQKLGALDASPCRCISPGAAGAAGGTVGLDLGRRTRRGCASAEASRGNELIAFVLQTQGPRSRHQHLREVVLKESREERKRAVRPKPLRKKKVQEGEGPQRI